MCVCVSVFIFSKSWLQWNHREEYLSWPLRMCIMFAIYFFPPISSKWSQWLLCISLEKLKDVNIFLAPSIEKAQTKMAGLLRAASTSWWRVSVIRRGLENNDVNKGTKQVGFNEMPYQDNTFLCVLHSGCLVQVCRGSQRNLNPLSHCHCNTYYKQSQKQRQTQRIEKEA